VIIFRYLSREVLVSMFAVSMILLLIILSGRFAQYLGDAAAGKLDAAVLMTLMGYRLLAYIELILPLGLFIAILLAYGRMYIDSEMTVLAACGMSDSRLVSYTLVCASFVAVLVAVFSLYLGPMGAKASEALLAEQRGRTEFEALKPERFHSISGDSGVTYAEGISGDKKRLLNVFMSELAADGARQGVSVMTAEAGETRVDEDTGKRYLVLYNGHQYMGQPGTTNYEAVTFGSYAQLLPDPDYEIRPGKETDGLSTRELLQRNSPEAQATLHWRFSLPVLVLVVALLAVPLSRTQPRRGRYVKMIPAILLYIVYLVAVNAARGVMEKEEALPWLLWLVHGLFFALALSLLAGSRMWFNLTRRKGNA
jgi:lipopolysaccharide export system permease protein